jgi:hypothetical protein
MSKDNTIEIIESQIRQAALYIVEMTVIKEELEVKKEEKPYLILVK